MADEYVGNENTAIEERDTTEGQDFDEEPRVGERSRGPRFPQPQGQGRGGKVFFKKKVCRFCTQKIKADYKLPEVLRRFTTDRGKIVPRRMTGTCAKHQRVLTVEIKKARRLALLPFVEK
ncbi:MAG: 30S ribosomal protein S18 [Spirochaetia bacterium]|jgi:small subunit ribosomal protein S18|nr:30S ribosomal protein S18 [Spirochaetia bacterium]